MQIFSCFFAIFIVKINIINEKTQYMETTLRDFITDAEAEEYLSSGSVAYPGVVAVEESDSVYFMHDSSKNPFDSSVNPE